MATVTVRDWIAALRSGDYLQGKGKLRSSDDKYCCLGVLCDLGDDERNRWTRRSSTSPFRFDGVQLLYPPLSVLRSLKGAVRRPFSGKVILPIAQAEVEFTTPAAPEDGYSLWKVVSLSPLLRSSSGYEAVSLLAHLNDRGAPFSEIADVIDLIFDADALIDVAPAAADRS